CCTRRSTSGADRAGPPPFTRASASGNRRSVMIWLAIGLALWVAAHLFKRALPAPRAALGDKGRGLVALGVAAGLVLMIVGYRAAPEGAPLWVLPAWAWHLNNTLMLAALFLVAIGRGRGAVRTRIRHPMLAGVA